MEAKERIRAVLERERDNKTPEAANFLARLKERPKLCLWGLGSHGHNWHGYLQSLGIAVDYVFDRSKDALHHWLGSGRKISSFEEMKKHREEMTVLVTMRSPADALANLRENGFAAYAATVNFFSFDTSLRYAGKPEKLKEMEKAVGRVLDLCADEASREIVCQTVAKWFDEAHEEIDCIPNQYFVKGIMPLSEAEHFVDVGAFDGDTIEAFLAATGGKYAHIHAFEMEVGNRQKLLQRIGADPRCDESRITVYPYGLSDKQERVRYTANGFSSVICENGTETAELRRLDDVLGEARVTLLKMDIEGAEPYALAGAARVIRRERPKLAICTYHRAEHLWQIPKQIGELLPDCLFYFRHHSLDEMETVCYAIPKERI